MNERWDLVMIDPEGVSRLIQLLAKRDKEEEHEQDTTNIDTNMEANIIRKDRHRKRAS